MAEIEDQPLERTQRVGVDLCCWHCVGLGVPSRRTGHGHAGHNPSGVICSDIPDSRSGGSAWRAAAEVRAVSGTISGLYRSAGDSHVLLFSNILRDLFSSRWCRTGRVRALATMPHNKQMQRARIMHKCVLGLAHRRVADLRR
jgi:hypothetical protein